MKQNILKWFSLFLTTALLASCGLFQSEPEEVETDEPTEQVDENTPEEEPSENETEDTTDSDINQDLAAWIPRSDNIAYHYGGTGNEYAEFYWFPQFNQSDYYQIARNNGGTTVVEIYKYREDEIVRTFQKEETYYRDNFSEIGTFTEEMVEETILKLPLAVGTSWEGDGYQSEITAVDHQLTVPYGTYLTIEVTSTFDEGGTTKRYYAESIGLVSEVYEDGEFVVESYLEATQENSTEMIPINVYVPDEQAMGMDIVEADIELLTNDPARTALQELFTGQNDRHPEINILPEGTEIQYLFLNDNNVVEVDVSEEFVTNMNAGSTGELFFIYDLVNTLSRYYGTEEVLLTVDGEPYTGAHMVMDEGETFSFNEEMVNE